MKVLHITPHFGGGVGQVLRAILPEFIAMGHSIIIASIEDINNPSQAFLSKQDIPFEQSIECNPNKLVDLVADADIVLVHWWNHPSLLHLLSTVHLPDARFVFWSHISGLTPPNGYSLSWLRAPEAFVFTTPLSHLAPEVEVAKRNDNKTFETVWSTSGIEALSEHLLPQTERDLGFVYCGNFDFSKMHQDFFKIAHALFNATGQPIRTIGPMTQAFEDMRAKTNSKDCVLPTGFIPESEKIDWLRRSKIFIYPLSEKHYGTCDQTIQEALTLGLPVIAFGNAMERQMLDGADAGAVVTSTERFISSSLELWSNEPKRHTQGLNAVSHAKKSFSLKHSVTKWDKILRDVIRTAAKKPISLSVSIENTAGAIFLDSLGFFRPTIEPLCTLRKKNHSTSDIENLNYEMLRRMLGNKAHWTSPTKSSPFHWLNKFPNDGVLKNICKNLS